MTEDMFCLVFSGLGWVEEGFAAITVVYFAPPWRESNHDDGLWESVRSSCNPALSSCWTKLRCCLWPFFMLSSDSRFCFFSLIELNLDVPENPDSRAAVPLLLLLRELEKLDRRFDRCTALNRGLITGRQTLAMPTLASMLTHIPDPAMVHEASVYSNSARNGNLSEQAIRTKPPSMKTPPIANFFSVGNFKRIIHGMGMRTSATFITNSVAVKP